MRYNCESLNMICKEIKITIEELLKRSETLVIYTTMNLYSKEGNSVGRVIKEHTDCIYKLGELVHSSSGSTSGNLYKFNSAEPSKVEIYILNEEETDKQKSSRRLSEEGYNYFNEKLYSLIKDDPPQMIQALNFVRKLIRQGKGLEKSITIAAKHYKVDHVLLASRNGSRVVLFRWAKKK